MERIGPHGLAGLLGEGRVFLAELSEPLRRRAAREILKRGRLAREVPERYFWPGSSA